MIVRTHLEPDGAIPIVAHAEADRLPWPRAVALIGGMSVAFWAIALSLLLLLG